MGRPKGSNRLDTQQKLIVSARKCFAEKGYAQSTFKDIAKQMGISHAALYAYYPSKLALYLDTVDKTQALLIPHYIQALEQFTSLKERIAAIFLAMAEEHENDNTITGLLAAVPIEIRRHSDIYAALMHNDNEVMSLLIDMFNEAKINGEIQSSLPTADLVSAIFGTGVGVALLHYGNDQTDLRGKMHALVDLISGRFFNP